MRTITSKKEFINLLKRIHEAGEVPPAPATPPASPPPAADPAEPAAPATDAAAGAQPEAEPITLDDIIEKLNIIRSGRSTKDDDVKSELENYILQFSEEDKTSLLAFLDGLGRILTSEEENAQPGATTPSATTPGAPAPNPPKQSSIQAPQKSAPKKSSAVPINVGGI